MMNAIFKDAIPSKSSLVIIISSTYKDKKIHLALGFLTNNVES